MGYPQSAGSPALREAAAAWIGRRFGVAVDAAHVGACVGTKELVAGLPHLLRLRNPQRDTVLYPGDLVPELRDGCDARRLPRGARSRSTPTGTSISTSVSDADAERALLLWVNEPGNPTSAAAGAAHLAHVAEWARARGIVVASDECYAEYAPEPATILASGTAQRARDAQPLEAQQPRGDARRLLRR